MNDLQKVEESITNFSTKSGLSTLHPNNIIQKYLNATPEDLRKLSASECSEGAFFLIRESIYIQKEIINKNNAKIHWINAKIDHAISGKTGNYDKYLPFTQKKICAIKDDEVLSELYKQSLQYEIQNKSVEYLPTFLKNLSETLTNLSKSKRENK